MDTSPENQFAQFREESLLRLERGDIPVGALRRLTALRGPQAKLFTSELTVDAFAMTREAGLHPVSQVMGVGVFDVSGVRSASSAPEKWDEGLTAALHRMWLEGRVCGAHIVTGITLRHAVPSDGPPWCREFTVTGTAMTWAHRKDGDLAAGEPVLTNLGALDCWKLLGHGYQPLALVTSTATGWAGVSLDSRSGELAKPSSAVRKLYAEAVAEIREEAAGLGALGLIGVSFEREMKEDGPWGLAVTVHAVATAIARQRRVPVSAGNKDTGLEIMPVRRTSG
jgi:uncharacterized protein YbjQ (UPF0145 family)